MSPNPPPLEIAQTPPEQRRAALALVLSDVPSEMRAAQLRMHLEMAALGETSLEGLITARRGTSLTGALWAQRLPASTGAVWPPQLAASEDETVADALLAAADRYLAAGDVRMAQALLDPDDTRAAERIGRGGYRYLTDLLYMACDTDDFPAAPPAIRFEYEHYRDERHDRLARLVESTYVGTLDCPALDGVRPIDEVLAGYRAAGVFSADRWLLLRTGEEDVGCLLLADFPQHDQWELVYMGLTPHARGDGGGRDIVRLAQWRTRQAGRQRLVVAVDAANTPAVKMYEQCRFRRWDRRAVFFKTFPVAT